MRFFTKVFKDQLALDANLLDGVNLRLVLFRNAPNGYVDYDYGVVPTVKKLIDGNYPGWELVTDPGYPFASSVTVNPSTMGTTEYTVFSSFLLEELRHKVGAMALGIEAVGNLWGETNPLIMVTTDPFPNGRTVLAPDDVVTAYQDPKAGNQRWLMAWDLTADGAVRVSSLTMGDIAVSIGPPDYQSSHHFDAWLYPQRVNYIANPSFEAVTTQYWATNGVFSQVPSEVGGFAGKFSGGNIIVESNVFPTDQNDGIWTIQMLVKGTGTMAVGLVFWSERYDQTYVDYGTDRWTLDPNTFLSIRTMRKCSEAVEAMLRLEVIDYKPKSATITNVILTSNVATITTGMDHNMKVGMTIDVTGVTPALFNGRYVVTAAPSASKLSYAKVNANVPSTGSTGQVAEVPPSTELGITMDRVLAEPGPLMEWPYFDGDEQYGAPDDFSWYGERGASYSLWYNNKRSIVSRIFTKPVYTGSVYTEQDDHGLAYNWVPAGTVVDYHLDVLRPNDLKSPPIPKNSGVMPDDVLDPVFGVPGGTTNVLITDGTLMLTARDAEEVHVAGGS